MRTQRNERSAQIRIGQGFENFFCERLNNKYYKPQIIFTQMIIIDNEIRIENKKWLCFIMNEKM